MRRTLEEAFGLENAAWCQDEAQRLLGLKLRGNPASPADLAAGLHKRVSGKSFNKTKFALGVLTELPQSWRVPLYIKEGLKWLANEVGLEAPTRLPETDVPAAAVAEMTADTSAEAVR
jgi:hypothetical protein